MTIYFMRHGETYFNRYGKMQGWCDMPLTKEGRLDALRSGKGMSDVRFDAVYTSDLRRTVETAQLFLRDNQHKENLVIQMMPEFREVSFGSLEGARVEEVWPPLLAKVDTSKGRNVQQELNALKEMDPEGLAEDFMEFWLRVERGLIKLVEEHRDTQHTILVVCHGLTIRNMLHELVPDFQLGEHIINSSISVAEYTEGQWNLKALNQTSHFAHRNEVEDTAFEALPIALKQS